VSRVLHKDSEWVRHDPSNRGDGNGRLSAGSQGLRRDPSAEIPEEIMNQQFGQEDLIDFQSVSLNNLKEVEDLLRSRGLDSAAFDAPWNCEYPLW
jgi:hypothetical protein